MGKENSFLKWDSSSKGKARSAPNWVLLYCFPATSQHCIFFWNFYCFFAFLSKFIPLLPFSGEIFAFPFLFQGILTFACCFTSLFWPHFSMQFFSFSLVLSMDISTLTLPTYFYFFTVISPFSSLFQSNLCFLFTLKRKKVDHGGGWAYIYIILYILASVIYTSHSTILPEAAVFGAYWPDRGPVPFGKMRKAGSHFRNGFSRAQQGATCTG